MPRARSSRVWGYLRETQADALKAGVDPDTGLTRTGLDEYLSVIYPNEDDWVHDKPIGQASIVRSEGAVKGLLSLPKSLAALPDAPKGAARPKSSRERRAAKKGRR